MTEMHEKLLTHKGWAADLTGGHMGDSPEKSKFELNSTALVGVAPVGRKK